MSIDQVLAVMDARPFTLLARDIRGELVAERQRLTEESQNAAAQQASLDVLAFTFSTRHRNVRQNPWRSHFRPFSSTTDPTGFTQYIPNIHDFSSATLLHWRARMETVRHPSIRARYADLLWELTPAIDRSIRRNPADAEVAIDAYIASALLGDEITTLQHRFEHAARALELAETIQNTGRITLARDALLALHELNWQTATGNSWRLAYDALDKQRGGLSSHDRNRFIADFEQLLARMVSSDNRDFDPHDAQRVAQCLRAEYTKLNRHDDLRRIWRQEGETFEQHADRCTPGLRMGLLDNAERAYRQAGEPGEAERARVKKEQAIREAQGEMAEFEMPYEITAEQMDAFVGRLVDEDPILSLMRVCNAFLLFPEQLDRYYEQLAENAPFMMLIPGEIIGDGMVAARLGGGEKGATLDHRLTAARFRVMDLHAYLVASFRRLIEWHPFSAFELMTWANRTGLFNPDPTLVTIGMQAWRDTDYVKAASVLIPQIERALRNMVGTVGRPTTKDNRALPGTSTQINMGDIVYDSTLVEPLGPLFPRLQIHMQAFFADPRGLNLRNELAHGALLAAEMNEVTATWCAHAVLALGLWMPMPTAVTQ